MPAQPEGTPAPDDGSLPASVAAGSRHRTWSAYVHVPFCTRRCGYCDFNTYTAAELGARAESGIAAFPGLVDREIALAAMVLERAGVASRPLSTVFFGGGTPTLLPAAALADILAGLLRRWPGTDDLEVTTEANPDSVDLPYLQQLAEAGFTRVSFGMQSAVLSVLATLDRTHDPERIPQVVTWARQAGLQTSLDLIYGTPGESDDDWRTSVEAALAAGPDHISAYALTVEPGTAMAGKVRRGLLAPPDDDTLADRYEFADDALGAAGYQWYEVSNWVRCGDGGAGPDDQCVPAPGAARTDRRCRHNLAYWTGQDWWGFGPGAHSHVGGVRWWNVKHPTGFADRVTAGRSPAAARELLDAADRRLEDVMLRIRLRSGLPADRLDPGGRAQAAAMAAEGLLAGTDPLVLTRGGRLLADLVVRRLLG